MSRRIGADSKEQKHPHGENRDKSELDWRADQGERSTFYKHVCVDTTCAFMLY